MAKAKFERTKPHCNIGTIGHVECPACNEWNTFFEQKLDAKELEIKKQNKQNSEPVALKDVAYKEINRLSTGFSELDRVLGGGLVDGSLILLGGEPRYSENPH